MKLSNAEMQEIDTILEKYCNTKEALSMKNFCQHGSVSTYKHVMYVTRVCYYLNKHFGLGADVKSLVVGAFLHDFYLYDWHDLIFIGKFRLVKKSSKCLIVSRAIVSSVLFNVSILNKIFPR